MHWVICTDFIHFAGQFFHVKPILPTSAKVPKSATVPFCSAMKEDGLTGLPTRWRLHMSTHWHHSNFNRETNFSWDTYINEETHFNREMNLNWRKCCHISHQTKARTATKGTGPVCGGGEERTFKKIKWKSTLSFMYFLKRLPVIFHSVIEEHSCIQGSRNISLNANTLVATPSHWYLNFPCQTSTCHCGNGDRFLGCSRCC